jgi:hypothetical protein
MKPGNEDILILQDVKSYGGGRRLSRKPAVIPQL